VEATATDTAILHDASPCCQQRAAYAMGSGDTRGWADWRWDAGRAAGVSEGKEERDAAGGERSCVSGLERSVQAQDIR